MLIDKSYLKSVYNNFETHLYYKKRQLVINILLTKKVGTSSFVPTS